MAHGARILGALAILLPCTARAGGMEEMSASAVVGMAMPTFGKFGTIATSRSETGFASRILMMGSQATFVNRGFLTGGRVVAASTKSQSATSGSHYGFHTVGFVVGYNLDMGPVDVSLAAELGVGELNFATGNAANGGLVEVDFLNAAPQIAIGVNLLSNFKISLVGSYMYGLPYRVGQFGTALLAKPTEAQVSGILGGVQFSFGFFK